MEKSLSDKAFTNGNDGAFMQPSTDGGVWDSGLTKREYFAAAALQGILSNSEAFKKFEKGFSEMAVSIADALLIELEK